MNDWLTRRWTALVRAQPVLPSGLTGPTCREPSPPSTLLGTNPALNRQKAPGRTSRPPDHLRPRQGGNVDDTPAHHRRPQPHPARGIAPRLRLLSPPVLLPGG